MITAGAKIALALGLLGATLLSGSRANASTPAPTPGPGASPGANVAAWVNQNPNAAGVLSSYYTRIVGANAGAAVGQAQLSSEQDALDSAFAAGLFDNAPDQAAVVRVLRAIDLAYRARAGAGSGASSPTQQLRSTPSTRASSTTVRTIQQELIAMGYNPGGVDGIEGAQTIAALNQLLQDVGQPRVTAIDAQAVATVHREYASSHLETPPVALRPAAPTQPAPPAGWVEAPNAVTQWVQTHLSDATTLARYWNRSRSLSTLPQMNDSELAAAYSSPLSAARNEGEVRTVLAQIFAQVPNAASLGSLPGAAGRDARTKAVARTLFAQPRRY